MNILFSKFNKLVDKFRSKAYRDSYVDAQIKDGIAFQIRAMRKDRNFSQGEFAELIGTKQAGVSRLENPDYGKYNLETLKRVASVMDVALLVRFVPFSELARMACALNGNDINVPAFDNDSGLIEYPLTEKITSINKYASLKANGGSDSEFTLHGQFDETIKIYGTNTL